MSFRNIQQAKTYLVEQATHIKDCRTYMGPNDLNPNSLYGNIDAACQSKTKNMKGQEIQEIVLCLQNYKDHVPGCPDLFEVYKDKCKVLEQLISNLRANFILSYALGN